MNEPVESSMHITDLRRVFVTEEIETHALAGIHLDNEKADCVSIAGPPGCGKPTLLAATRTTQLFDGQIIEGERAEEEVA